MPRPRKPGSGGRRQGAPATSYSNRSDLTGPKTQPITVAPSQQYGQGVAQTQAQQAIPLPGAGAGLPSAPPAAAPGGPSIAPGGLGPLNAPTQRPGEPITAGLPSGPGPGPEALTPPDPLTKAAAVLNMLGSTADPQTAVLRARVNAMLANQGAA